MPPGADVVYDMELVSFYGPRHENDEARARARVGVRLITRARVRVIARAKFRIWSKEGPG